MIFRLTVILIRFLLSVIDKFNDLGEVSASIEFATMLSKQGESPVFTELRAVDNNYPLYGEIETIPEGVANKYFLITQKPTVLINESIQNLLNIRLVMTL